MNDINTMKLYLNASDVSTASGCNIFKKDKKDIQNLIVLRNPFLQPQLKTYESKFEEDLHALDDDEVCDIVEKLDKKEKKVLKDETNHAKIAMKAYKEKHDFLLHYIEHNSGKRDEESMEKIKYACERYREKAEKCKAIVKNKTIKCIETVVKSRLTFVDHSMDENCYKTVSSSIIDLKDGLKEKLRGGLEEISNKTRGTVRENTSLSMFEKKEGVKVSERNDKFYKKTIWFKKFSLTIGGRVDGIIDNNQIIETKNRKTPRKGDIYMNDKIQLEIYMWLLDKESAVLIELCNDEQTKTTYLKQDGFLDSVFKKVEENVNEILDSRGPQLKK